MSLVSIIIPCFNAARWLAQTLDSTRAQTHTPVEIILIDDGSTDDSLRIAHRSAGNGVHVVAQGNRGASAARNHGLSLARGEFIQFLDADDLLSPGKIAGQLRLLERAPAGTIATCAWGRFTDTPEQARFVDDAVFRDFNPVDFLVLAGDTGVMMHPGAWLVPREIVNRAGPWNEALSLNDDGEYFSRVMLASTGIRFCGDPQVRSFYRSAMPGSLSQRRSEASVRSQFRSIELITEHLLAAEDSPRTRRAAGNFFQRFVHDYHPAPAELEHRAEQRALTLGSTLGAPPMGPKTAAAARILGWKRVARLKQWFRE